MIEVEFKDRDGFTIAEFSLYEDKLYVMVDGPYNPTSSVAFLSRDQALQLKQFLNENFK